MAHPMTAATALMFAGCAFHALRLETQPVQEFALRLIEIAEQKRLPMFRPYGLIFQGWAQVLGLTAGSPSTAQLRLWQAELRAMRHRSGLPVFVLLSAQALQHSGTREEALSAVDQGLALSDEVSPANRAEFYRLKGELLNSDPSGVGEGDAYLRRALVEARQHGSRFHELRATMSLARRWSESGRRAEAHQALAEIYAWFSEGFDTPDLRSARALLDSLA
jgi:adenylate cyclase